MATGGVDDAALERARERQRSYVALVVAGLVGLGVAGTGPTVTGVLVGVPVGVLASLVESRLTGASSGFARTGGRLLRTVGAFAVVYYVVIEAERIGTATASTAVLAFALGHVGTHVATGVASRSRATR